MNEPSSGRGGHVISHQKWMTCTRKSLTLSSRAHPRFLTWLVSDCDIPLLSIRNLKKWAAAGGIEPAYLLWWRPHPDPFQVRLPCELSDPQRRDNVQFHLSVSPQHNWYLDVHWWPVYIRKMSTWIIRGLRTRLAGRVHGVVVHINALRFSREDNVSASSPPLLNEISRKFWWLPIQITWLT